VADVEPNPRRSLEQPIHDLCERQCFAEAATATLKLYGGELMGYLAVMSRNEVDAGDAFSLFSEDLWRGLPKFRWESSLRTWAYILARRALCRLLREPERHRAKVELPPSAEFLDVATVMRTSMLLARAGKRGEAELLRDQLDPDDRTLLILRVDRELAWLEIARIMGDDDALAEADLKRLAAALRKRYERVKAQLRELAAARSPR
jgi:RNA polymerase sigma-70 factor (ECF subfamily)